MDRIESNRPRFPHRAFARAGYRLLIGLAFLVRELRRLTKIDLFRLSAVSPEPFHLSPLYTAWRIATGKRVDCVRRLSSPIPTDTPRVLIAVATLGELNSLRPVINHLINGGYTVAFLVHCATTAHLIAEEIPEAEIFELPVDLRRNARTILNTLTPSCVLVGELLYGSPIQLLTEARSRGIPVVLLNGVPFATPHARPERWLHSYYREFFGLYSHIFTSTTEAQSEFLEYGVPAERITLAPSTKWIGSELTARERRVSEELAKLFKIIPGQSVITVSCLHPGEEALLIRLAEHSRTLSPPPLIIAAPRWPQSWGQMNVELLRHGIVTAHRTGLACRQYGAIKPEVIFLDMLGELRAALSISTVCVVGGTFVGNGQDPLEALRLGVPVVMGPSTKWMNGICETTIARRAALGAATMDEAADTAIRLATTEAERDRMAGLAYLLLREHHSDLTTLIAQLPLPSIFATRHDAVPPRSASSGSLPTHPEVAQVESP